VILVPGRVETLFHAVVFRVCAVDRIPGDFVRLEQLLRYPAAFRQQFQGLLVKLRDLDRAQIVEIRNLDLFDKVPLEGPDFCLLNIDPIEVETVIVAYPGVEDLLGEAKPGLVFVLPKKPDGFVLQILWKPILAQHLVQGGGDRIDKVSHRDHDGPTATGPGVPGVECQGREEHGTGLL